MTEAAIDLFEHPKRGQQTQHAREGLRVRANRFCQRLGRFRALAQLVGNTHLRDRMQAPRCPVAARERQERLLRRGRKDGRGLHGSSFP